MNCPIRGGDMPDTPITDSDLVCQSASAISTCDGVSLDTLHDVNVDGDMVEREKTTDIAHA